MRPARALVALLADPGKAAAVTDWSAILTAARAESLLGSLAFRLEHQRVPEKVARLLDEARRDSLQARTQAVWEAEMARRALAPTGAPLILLKGTAFAAAGLCAARGRSIGDLDILVPSDRLQEVQQALMGAGWEWVKEDEYDDLYYRRWMHELPPLIHKTRDRMIDVHHTILPPTARPTPNAEALIGAAVKLDNDLHILSPEDMIVHAAAHLFADGDLAGGLRNLWDINCLVREFAAQDEHFWRRLGERARLHQLRAAVGRALRLTARLYHTPVDPVLAGRARPSDILVERRLLARNGWGQPTRRALRFAFYVRSHWMRMPPLMLARHLWTKATR
jgi:hypothetical protein